MGAVARTLRPRTLRRAAERAADRSFAEQVADCLSDITTFGALVEIKHKDPKKGGSIQFNYERWNAEQKAFQRNRTGLDLVLKPRQIGFSTLELARDLQFAVVNRGVNVLVVVHDSEIKDQLFLNLRVMAECLKKRGLLPATRYSTKTELVFRDTGSAVRIVEAGSTEAAAEKKGRSGTIHRLHATEIAFWGRAEDTWNAISASTSESTEIVIESTPNGASGLFYEMIQKATQGVGRYKLHFFRWYDHKSYRTVPLADFDPTPRDKWERRFRADGCTDQQIAWWRSKVVENGLDKSLQEYPVDVDSCFRVAERQYFDPEVIDDLFERVTEPQRHHPLMREGRRFGDLAIYENPSKGLDYVVGGDVAEGTGHDASSATVIEKRSGRTVATFWSDSIEPGDFGLALTEIGTLYNRAMLAPERNNHGHAALRAIQHEAHYTRLYYARDGKPGWLTDAASRPVMIDDLGAAIREKSFWTPDRATASECKTLVRNDKGKVEARAKGTKDGAKDDRWVSWCIAFQVRSQPAQELQRVHLPGY
jgi:hypothetical protein